MPYTEFLEAMQQLINAVASTSVDDVGDAYYAAKQAYKEFVGSNPLEE